jgi:hypothetical protein
MKDSDYSFMPHSYQGLASPTAPIHLLNCCNAAPSPSDSTRVVHARRQVAAELEDMARLRDP